MPAAEIQEVCLGTDTMPSDDYLACRAFDLTISIFNNAGILREFFRAAEALGVRRSTVLRRIFLAARDSAGPIAGVYDEFHRAEAKNFFGSREALERFLAAPGGIEAYLRGEYGVNHIYKARTTALVRLLPEVMALARAAVEEALAEAGIEDALIGRFFDELTQLSLARKSDLTAVDREIEITTHFDFPALHAAATGRIRAVPTCPRGSACGWRIPPASAPTCGSTSPVRDQPRRVGTVSPAKRQPFERPVVSAGRLRG